MNYIMDIFKKHRDIKRMNLTYEGKGIYKQVTKGGHTTCNLRGDIISQCSQELTCLWRWDWLLREFELVSYNIDEINMVN